MIKLTHINITKEAYQSEPNWRFDLESRTDTCWTIERGLTELAALDRAKEFSWFSGLPVTRFGLSI